MNLLAMLLACLSFSGSTSPRPRFVFLFIGDGMGLNQVALTEAYQASVAGDSLGFAPVSFTRFPVLGTTTTQCATRRITESSAAATALATGSKAGDGTLGVAPGTRAHLSSIAVEARAAGRKTALITTVSVDHATPAGFYAHVGDRNAYNAIAMQLPRSGLDLFAGGGFLAPVGDSGNVWNALRDSGYALVRGREALAGRRPGGRLVALPPATPPLTEVPWTLDRPLFGADQPTLADFVRESSRLLEGNRDGFFLMAEGGRVDWACHANDARSAIGEVQSLDSAVQTALAFAARHPGEVLIVVLADHETGGLALGNAALGYQSNFGLLRHQVSSKDALADSLRAALTAKDSLAALDSCLALVGRRLGLGRAPGLELTDADRTRLANAWSEELARDPGKRGGLLAAAGIAILATKAGVGWTTGAHTAQPVPVYAWGAGAEAFAGRLDNTDVAVRLRQAMGLRPVGPATKVR